MTHNVPQAAPHRVVEVHHLGAVGRTTGSGSVSGLHVSGGDATNLGVPLRSLLDHLLLEPFHLKKRTHRILVQIDGLTQMFIL